MALIEHHGVAPNLVTDSASSVIDGKHRLARTGGGLLRRIRFRQGAIQESNGSGATGADTSRGSVLTTHPQSPMLVGLSPDLVHHSAVITSFSPESVHPLVSTRKTRRINVRALGRDTLPDSPNEEKKPKQKKRTRRVDARPLPDLLPKEYTRRDAAVKTVLAAAGFTVAGRLLARDVRAPAHFPENIIHPSDTLTIVNGDHAVQFWPQWFLEAFPFVPDKNKIDKASSNGDLTASDWSGAVNARVVNGFKQEKAEGRDVVLLALDSDSSLTGTDSYAWIPHLPLDQEGSFPKYIVSIGTEVPSDFDINPNNINSTKDRVDRVSHQLSQLASDLNNRYNYFDRNGVELEVRRILEMSGVAVAEGVTAALLIKWGLRTLGQNPPVKRRGFLKGLGIGTGIAAFEAAKVVNEQGYVPSVIEGNFAQPEVQAAITDLQSLTDHPLYGNYLDLKTQARTALAIQMLIDTQKAFPQIAQELDIPSDTKGIKDPHGFALWGALHSDARLADESYREALIKADAQNVAGYIDWSLHNKYRYLLPYRDRLLTIALQSFTSEGACLIVIPWGTPAQIKGTPKDVIRKNLIKELGPEGVRLVEENLHRPFSEVLTEWVDEYHQESIKANMRDQVTNNLEASSIGIPDQTVRKWVSEVGVEDFGLKPLPSDNSLPSGDQLSNNSHYLPQNQH